MAAGLTAEVRGDQVPAEPVAGSRRHLVERAGLLEEMRGPADDLQQGWSVHSRHRVLVERDDFAVESANREERWGQHPAKGLASQVGAAASGDTARTASGRSAAARSAVLNS